MKAMLTVLAGFFLIVSGTAAAAKSDDAYLLVKKRDFKKTYKVIALAPVDADPYLEMPDSVAAMLEQEVTARLQKRGYTVIPSSVLAGIRKTMEAQVGGLAHPCHVLIGNLIGLQHPRLLDIVLQNPICLQIAYLGH